MIELVKSLEKDVGSLKQAVENGASCEVLALDSKAKIDKIVNTLLSEEIIEQDDEIEDDISVFNIFTYKENICAFVPITEEKIMWYMYKGDDWLKLSSPPWEE